MMHILIAPNAFKNSLSAQAAAEAIAKGLHQSSLQCNTECFPIADGGDGTAQLINQKLNARMVPVTVRGPLGEPIETSFGLIEDGQTAVIELADASGLRLLKTEELNPLLASTYGTGELMKAALDEGVAKIIIAMGGSATVDGATGILQALGVKFLGSDGHELKGLPQSLTELESIDTLALDNRIANCEVVVLCDVDNQLLGANGAAAIFGPQKGADAEAVKLLDAGLAKLAEVALKTTGKNMATIKYGGAAGGASAGVYALLNAKLVNGINYLLDITGFDEALQKAQLVITGEGSIDEQTLQGKGPYGVASRAKAKGIPAIGVAGKIPLESNSELNKYFDALLAIGNQPTDINEALANTEQNLARIGRTIGEMLAIANSAKL